MPAAGDSKPRRRDRQAISAANATASAGTLVAQFRSHQQKILSSLILFGLVHDLLTPAGGGGMNDYE
jgi:hypothetical protein